VPGRQISAPLGLVVILVIVLMFVTAWRLAKRALSPKDIFGLTDNGENQIGRLAFLRSFAGLLTIGFATVRVRGASGVTADSILHISQVLVVGVLSVLMCAIFTVAIARPRRALITGVRRPIVKMILTFLPLYVSIVLGHLPAVTHVLNMKHPSIRASFVESSGGWLVLLVLWLAIFGLWALYFSARFLYGAGEVHPLLGPLVTIVAVGILTAMEVARANRLLGGLDILFARVVGQESPQLLSHPAPEGLVLTLTVGGFLTTMIFAFFEWGAIARQGDGISLRRVPSTKR
jgi:hypothetical protein